MNACGGARVRGALCAALLVAAACSTPLDEVAELATSGGEAPSDGERRPIRGTTRAIIIALDGVGHGAFESAIAAGRLECLERVFGELLSDDDRAVREHAYLAANVATTMPSTTMAAWATIFTGSPPGEHGIIGNEWFDRTTATYYAPAPVSVEGAAHTIRIYTEDLIGAQLGGDTLIERLDLRAHVSLGQIHRGADVLTYPDGMDLTSVMGIFAAGVFSPHGVMGEAYIALDEGSITPLLAAIEEHGLPDVQVVYFPGVDLITHASDPPMDVQQNHLETVIEPAIARVLEAYREADALDDTYVFVVADHGHTSVEASRALGAAAEDAMPSALRGAGFVMRPPELMAQGTGFNATLAYQGGLANVYLADRSQCTPAEEGLASCVWGPPPRYEEDVLAAAAALAGSEALGGRLEMVLVREPSAPGTPQREFQVYTSGGVVSIAEHLRDHPRPDWVEFEERMRDLAVGALGHRAGDVIVIARLGPSIPRAERSYFSGAYHSWHGSPTELDSYVPFVVAHPGRTGAELRTAVERALRPRRSTLRFAPLVESLLR